MTPIPPAPAALRCAHQVNPLGVAPDRVRFSWLPAGNSPQRGYQIQIQPIPNGGGWLSDAPLLWDSGERRSGESADVPYAGPALMRGCRYGWRVRVWNDLSPASPWSEPATFETELGPVDGWLTSWISPGKARRSATPPSGTGPVDPIASTLSPVPYLRRTFTLDKPALSARLYVTAPGLYKVRLRLNGQRVGDGFLAHYRRRLLYQTYDVMSLLVPGENVLGAIVADRWHAGFVRFDDKRAGAHYGRAPQLLAELAITFADGTSPWIVTDEGWRSSNGAIRHADLLIHRPGASQLRSLLVNQKL